MLILYLIHCESRLVTLDDVSYGDPPGALSGIKALVSVPYLTVSTVQASFGVVCDVHVALFATLLLMAPLAHTDDQMSISPLALAASG